MSRFGSDFELKTVEELAFESLVRVAAKRPPHKLIRFPDVFSRICPLLSIKKADAWNVLHALENQGCIKIVPFHGIRIMHGDNV
jgi:hypothetical protein